MNLLNAPKIAQCNKGVVCYKKIAQIASQFTHCIRRKESIRKFAKSEKLYEEDIEVAITFLDGEWTPFHFAIQAEDFENIEYFFEKK